MEPYVPSRVLNTGETHTEPRLRDFSVQPETHPAKHERRHCSKVERAEYGDRPGLPPQFHH